MSLSHHELRDPVRCRGCNEPTRVIVQRCEGLRVSDPVCPACDLAARAETEAKVAAKAGQHRERHERRRARETEHVLSPLLTNVEAPRVRKPGEQGWVRGEVGL